MYLRTRLALTLGGLLASILIVSGAALIATDDLADRIKTVDQAASLGRHLDKIERSRRQYQLSGSAEHLRATHRLIEVARGEIAKLKSMNAADAAHGPLIQRLQHSFEQYGSLLDAYADSETQKATAGQKMSVQLDSLKSMATTLKQEKESEYHQTFAVSTSFQEAADRLKTTLRLTALANEIIVIQMAIERDVALFKGGDALATVEIPLEIGRIAEIADRIRRIEEVRSVTRVDASSPGLPDRLAARSNQFQIDFDHFRLATREQAARAAAMADIALEVIQLIQRIKALQTDAAVKSSGWTMALSILGIATALVLGGLAALVIRNGIIAPLTAITKTMQQMSTGQLSLTVPGSERRDELGAMAQALEIFRRNSLEARRLTAQNIDVERRLVKEQADAAILEKSLQHEKELNAQQRRFVSLVSHEFRTPLAIIDGLAQRLIRKGDNITADQRNEYCEKIKVAVSRLIDLIESVLSTASLEAGTIEFKPAPMDLRTLVRNACDNQQEISNRHRIEVDIDALPESYAGDGKLLHQVIVNLLSNAVKYSPDADLVRVTGSSTSDGLEIAVRDFGLGIPEQELPKLFQRFFRASTSSGIQGTGIGLNLVKSLIEMHDGTIDMTSIEGEGSTFIVRLPHRDESSLVSATAA